MPSGHESRVERQIREAQERGEFDNLPGAGSPLPGHGGTYDENWWIRDWVRRENLTGVGPASLMIRKEAEQMPERLDRESSEAAVRDVVTALNERIVLARRGLVDGPPVLLPVFDVERVVETWRRRRNA
ncbi:DUF1992 domain-containing protein [Micromonospora sp. WMMD1102]|uniref:DnaJ family domain-containing protein n=1 Tax=Micromonospora sp. WMMD1102 TaxID=3016105 RepID=UPI0024151E68|nr:DUF1992 domain-containing protein [Micromonospora sp. WMMD1102]MDG4786791.1 DUF1992 domain-containing protein [Micromonospora sp. WMMD1102]